MRYRASAMTTPFVCQPTNQPTNQPTTQQTNTPSVPPTLATKPNETTLSKSRTWRCGQLLKTARPVFVVVGGEVLIRGVDGQRQGSVVDTPANTLRNLMGRSVVFVVGLARGEVSVSVSLSGLPHEQ
mmetsp:Transcript_19830/g.55175  ORF Transcript_19830/g.55175 Transcript_19830/m.55175 type:complete len:127 (-) Transcript_19830:176-556(-)